MTRKGKRVSYVASWRFAICAIMLCLVLLTNGCISSWFGKGREPITDSELSLAAEQVRLDAAAFSIKENSTTIHSLSEDITGHADNVIEKHPDIKEVPKIKSSAEKITLLSAQDIRTAEQLQLLNEQLGARDKEIQALKEEVQKWEDESFRKQKKIWIAIMSFSGVGMVVGIFLIISNYAGKLGFTLLAGSGATAAVAYFMVNYAEIIAIAGGILLLAVILYVLYNAWVDRKAVKENVMAMEVSKHRQWDRSMKDKVGRLQSESTKKRVKQVKRNLKDEGYYLMPNEDNPESSTQSSTQSETA